MVKLFRIHYVIPGVKAPAPHHQSGVIPLANGPAEALGQGMISVCACDPNIILDDLNRGTDAPYAIACKACAETDVWKAAIRANPHPSTQRVATETEDVSEAIKGCC
jgi:hypothetical protein